MIDIPRDAAGRALSGSGSKLPAAPASSPAAGNRATANPLVIAGAWVVVGIPLAWGVTQTVKTSILLLHQPAAHAAVQH